MKLPIVVLFLSSMLLVRAHNFEEAEEDLGPLEDELMSKRGVIGHGGAKDKIEKSCCLHFKVNKGCHYSYIRDVCAYTCGCFNHLSKESCGIYAKRGLCKNVLVKTYCRYTCKFCPWLPSSLNGGK